ncbi:MAG: carbamoyltransferase HypF [Candidatus Paceibacterota bacterium]|jgi:hydrogenase maturation protein HypF|nr:carbamoyltransferase HypF [Candidatus Paceibacterota bacterium]
MTETGLRKKRLKIKIQGTVQGVGFRPFVLRLAEKLGVLGWVINGVRGVEIAAEADVIDLLEFARCVVDHAPEVAAIDFVEYSYLDDTEKYEKFEIRESDNFGEKTALVLPDLATCPECQSEIFDRKNRRFRYPFTNCTNCGPRHSIIERVPYDRPNTSMKVFPMCPECEKEYNDPANRRFYAQPNACPVCGPHLVLLDQNGKDLATRDSALRMAEEYIDYGKVVALKGLGGFQLIVDAINPIAIKKLRERKGRPGQKPFAVMYPNIELVKAHCEVSMEEEKLLLSRQSPIVLLKRKDRPSEVEKVPHKDIAPDSNVLGVMLPYTPLHHLLMADLGFPIVATSGNLSDEPIITDEDEAVVLLGHIADAFLVHNRGIVRHVDDSIARVINGKTVILRRARGYAPMPIKVESRKSLLRQGYAGQAPVESTPTIVAFGPDLKNVGAVLTDGKVYLTQHIGDMGTTASGDALLRSINDTLAFREKKPEAVVCDLHPDYASTRMAEAFAEEHHIPLYRVQHHKAHILSAMTENDIVGKTALGVAWDGTGYGEDGTIWGGEFFRVSETGLTRYAHLRTFGLIGGDKAAREPRYSAAAILYEIYGKEIFDSDRFASVKALIGVERKLFPQMLKNKMNVVMTSSAGRLFDAVASILDICHSSDYEGHAAILLEQAIGDETTNENYEISVVKDGDEYIFNWEPMIRDIVYEYELGIRPGVIAKKIHNTLARVIARIFLVSGEGRLVLSGGCFQNKYLLETTIKKLEGYSDDGRIFTQGKVPMNDGGIALGQITAVLDSVRHSGLDPESTSETLNIDSGSILRQGYGMARRCPE